MGDYQRNHDLPSRSIWGETLTNAIVYFIAIMIGCLYIVISKFNGFPIGWVTFGPVALMILYALLVGLARPLRLRDDHTGDNLYYMGFLFTLSSLGVALYQFNATGAAEIIVQNFGIAIASTITGISLRIFFNQMRRDPIDVEAEARLELAQAASKVRRSLDNIALEFNQFGRVTQQMIRDGLMETRQSFGDATKQLLLSLDEATKHSLEPLQKATTEIGKSLAEITIKFDEAGTNLLKGLETSTATSMKSIELVSEQNRITLDKMTNSAASAWELSNLRVSSETETLLKELNSVGCELNKLVDKLSKLQTPDQVIEIKLTPMVQGLTRAVTNFGKSAEGQSASIGESIETARRTLEQYASNLSLIQNQIEARDSTLGIALDDIKTISRLTSEQFASNASAIQTQIAARDVVLGLSLEEIKTNAHAAVQICVDLHSSSTEAQEKVEAMEKKLDFVVSSIAGNSSQNGVS